MEWELIEIIVSFLGISCYDPKEDYEFQCFTNSKIKQYYEEITYQKFNKVYGKNGLKVLLSFRNGIEYDNLEKMWYVYPHKFIQQLKKDYIKDVDTYGVDFDKPWRRYNKL